jgi:toxin-antitoxin system PIN domain toxin
VILIDANLLVYAKMAGVPEHAAARDWLDERLGGTPKVGLPWPSLLAFMRLVTNRRIFERPQTLAAAWAQVEAWLLRPPAWTPQPTESHREILGRLVADAGERGSLVPDLHLAALAIEHGLTLCSTDADFARFRGLRWENPLHG